MEETGIKLPILLHYWMHPTQYCDCIAEMHRLHRLVSTGQLDSLVIITRHFPIITGGLLDKNVITDSFSVPFQLTDRGGGITYHDPGQLVIYPIIRLADFGISSGEYVKLLQKWAAKTIELLGFSPITYSDKIGVWIKDKTRISNSENKNLRPQHGRESKKNIPIKITTSGATCSSLNSSHELVKKVAFIGARIKSGVSIHGFSINLCTNLELFAEFDPCGVKGLIVGNLLKQSKL